MAISPIMLNGSIQQTDNVLNDQTRQAERGVVDQGNIQIEKDKKEETQAHQVMEADETVFKDERFDAKEKGKNSYSGDGGRNRRRKNDEGRVVTKPEGGFDIKI